MKELPECVKRLRRLGDGLETELSVLTGSTPQALTPEARNVLARCLRWVATSMDVLRHEPQTVKRWREAIRRNSGDTFYHMLAKLRADSEPGSLNALTANVLDWLANVPEEYETAPCASCGGLCPEGDCARPESVPDVASVVKATLRVAQECVEVGFTPSRIVERLRVYGVRVIMSDLHPYPEALSNVVEVNREYEATLRRERDQHQHSSDLQRCVIGEYCAVHEFVHGAEAEELRSGIEILIENGDEVEPVELQRFLDDVDARDSCAYAEARPIHQPVNDSRAALINCIALQGRELTELRRRVEEQDEAIAELEKDPHRETWDRLAKCVEDVLAINEKATKAKR